MIGIYKITNPKGKIYIGQSVNIKKRFKTYMSLSCEKQTHLYNSFVKYGFECHILEIIEVCDISELNTRERYWQDYYSVLGGMGLNCKLTHTNDKSGVYSELTKKKISEAVRKAKKLNPITDEQRRKISIRVTGKGNPMYSKTHTKETMEKILSNRRSYKGKGNVMYGKTHTKEARKKISDSAKINRNRSKIILDMNNGVFYNSLKEYTDLSSWSRSYIIKQLLGHSPNTLNIKYA